MEVFLGGLGASKLWDLLGGPWEAIGPLNPYGLLGCHFTEPWQQLVVVFCEPGGSSKQAGTRNSLDIRALIPLSRERCLSWPAC